jgi:hypothetical protein
MLYMGHSVRGSATSLINFNKTNRTHHWPWWLFTAHTNLLPGRYPHYQHYTLRDQSTLHYRYRTCWCLYFLSKLICEYAVFYKVYKRWLTPHNSEYSRQKSSKMKTSRQLPTYTSREHKSTLPPRGDRSRPNRSLHFSFQKSLAVELRGFINESCSQLIEFTTASPV